MAIPRRHLYGRPAEPHQDQALAFMAGRLSIDPERPFLGRATLFYAHPDHLVRLMERGEVWEPREIDVQIAPGLWDLLLKKPDLLDARLAKLRLVFRTDLEGRVRWALTDYQPLPPCGDARFPDWIYVQGQVVMVGQRTLVVRVHATSVAPFTLRLGHDGKTCFSRQQRRWGFELKLARGKLRIVSATPLGEPLPEPRKPKSRRPKLRKRGHGPAKGKGPARPARPVIRAR